MVYHNHTMRYSADAPISFTPHHTAGGLKQTVRTIPTHNLLRYTSRAFNLMTVLAVE